jgi:hypothetical protein
VLERGLQLGSGSAVDGKGVAQEKMFVEFSRVTAVRYRRVAGEDHDGLALYIDTGVVIPFIFGCYDPIAGKHKVGIPDFDPLSGKVDHRTKS